MPSGKTLTKLTSIVALTDSTGGTVSNLLDDTTAGQADDVAALAGKVNELVAAVNTLIADFKRRGEMDQ